MASENSKLIILDTNVFIEDANALMAFEKEQIGIPIVVLEELDHLKTEASFRGRNAREAIRVLDALRGEGSLQKGIQLPNGSTVKVLFPEQDHAFQTKMPEKSADNEILEIASSMQRKGFKVELISKDINMRVKADALGILARDYNANLVNEGTVYRGWITIETSASQLKKDIPDILLETHKEHPFTINEFIVIQSMHNTFNARLFRYHGNNKFQSIQAPDLKWSLQPRNIQQRMALDLLFDDTIKLVTLIGSAGTGKTFLALVAALHEVLLYHNYEKVLITRPVIPLGPDIGYLPGDIREKLFTWMQPIYDNMDFIVHASHATQRQLGYKESLGIYKEEDSHSQDKNKYKKRKAARESDLPTLDQLIVRQKISLEAITYMRGRSIPYQFILIDEAQNLTPHEVKTLVSRVGEGSKVVLTGDPFQIDAPHLDFSNNGLVVATERFKGQSLFGTVFLESTERSELSRLAATLL